MYNFVCVAVAEKQEFLDKLTPWNRVLLRKLIPTQFVFTRAHHCPLS